MILRVTLVAIILGIAYLSLTPSDSITIGNDKISHFIAYGILMTNVGLITFHKRRSFTSGIVLSLGYGALIECVQHFVPGRFMSGYDMLANAGGVGFGVLTTVLFYRPLTGLLKKIRIL